MEALSISIYIMSQDTVALVWLRVAAMLDSRRCTRLLPRLRLLRLKIINNNLVALQAQMTSPVEDAILRLRQSNSALSVVIELSSIGRNLPRFAELGVKVWFPRILDCISFETPSCFNAHGQ